MVGVKRRWAVCASMGLLGACNSHSTKPVPAAVHEGEASLNALADQHMTHYQLALGSRSTGGVPTVHPSPPRYPPAMLARCPWEVQLQVLVIVGTDGKVNEVRVDKAVVDEAAFVSAVRTAAMAWQFEPLVIRHWAADAQDEMHAVDTQARPFSLPYEFRFACHAGRRQVSSSSAPGK